MKHAPPDLKANIESLMSSLDENEIFRIKKGRMINNENIIKDVIAVGLQNLMLGEKNPLSDYNTAFKWLQMQRRMKPVSLTLLQDQSGTPASHIQPVLPQTPLEPAPIPSLPTSTKADKDAEDDPEQVSEVEKILQDLANGVVDETLPRLTEEDIAFHMDEVVVEEEEVVEEDSDDDSNDESDIGWINEEE